MRRAVRAIIIKDDKLLVMHRNKFGHEYDTLPGGNVEIGETLEEALQREVQEETTLSFNSPKLVFIEHAGQPYGDQYIFLCEYLSGEPELTPNSEEDIINKMGENLFKPAWLALSKLEHSPFLSKKLKFHILDAVKSNWPEKPLEFTSEAEV